MTVITKKNRKPGKGWYHVHGPVWEHVSGTRIHLGGFVKLHNGAFFSASSFPECLESSRFLAHGNRKRGLMAWAAALMISSSALAHDLPDVDTSGAPSIYAQDGTYLGRLSSNRFDPESTSNPVGIYGSPVSPYSINNPVGVYGSRFSPLSPNNPYVESPPASR